MTDEELIESLRAVCTCNIDSTPCMAEDDCRDALAAADRIEALTAKLAGGVIAEYDDGSTIFLSGYAGGAADGGAWSTLTLMEKAPDGTLREREYKAQGDWRATLAEIKGESHD